MLMQMILADDFNIFWVSSYLQKAVNLKELFSVKQSCATSQIEKAV